MYSTLKGLITISFGFLLTACADYDFRINNNVVYTPPTLLNKLNIADAALNLCMLQTIEDQKIYAIENFTQLACTNAGITDLTGLERFYNLKILVLDDNAITNVQILNQLSDLTIARFANNNIKDVSRMSDMSYLATVDLGGNDNLSCGSAKVLTKVVKNLNLPEHCADLTK